MTTEDNTVKPVFWVGSIPLCGQSLDVQKNLDFFSLVIMKSVTADGSLRSPTGGVEELYPAPHIHEQFTIQKWLRMATTLRTPLRITTSRLSTMR